MESRARVLLVRDGRATLACEQASSCGACGPGGGCGLRWLAGNGRRTLQVPLPLDGREPPLQSGETVTVSVADSDLLRTATRLYVPPLVGLLSGPLLVRGALQGGEGAAILAALAGLLLGWLTARAWVRAAPPQVLVRRTNATHPAA